MEKYMAERLTTGEICTRSVTIAFRGTSLNGAARLMRENHVGCLVVVDEVGGMRIVVATDLVTAREDDSLIDLMHSMRRKGVRRIPVVGGQGELVGLVALDDVLDILSQELSLLVAAIDSEGKRERQVRK
jgi:CBS domain-containing protein